MGTAMVLECNRTLDASDLMAVGRAGTAMAVQMLKEKAAVETQYKLRGDLVNELLAGSFGGDDNVLNRSAYLGMNLRVPRAVLVINVDRVASFASERRDAGQAIALKERLLDIVERTCRMENSPGMYKMDRMWFRREPNRI